MAHGIERIGGDAAGGNILDESPGVVIIPRRHLDLSLCIGFFQSQPLASGVQRIAILRQQQVALAVTDEGQAMAHIVAGGGGHAAGPDFAGLMAHNVIADPGGAAGFADLDRAAQCVIRRGGDLRRLIQRGDAQLGLVAVEVVLVVQTGAIGFECFNQPVRVVIAVAADAAGQLAL